MTIFEIILGIAIVFFCLWILYFIFATIQYLRWKKWFYDNEDDWWKK